MADVRSKEITNPERIRRIIGILRLDGREVEVHIPHYIEVAKIVDTTQDVFVVKITDSFVDYKSEELDTVYLNFVFSGVELFGKCKIVHHRNFFYFIRMNIFVSYSFILPFNLTRNK